MATIGYTIQDNLYTMSEDFDMAGRILMQELANYADQIDKLLVHDSVSRTKDETLDAFKIMLNDYAVLSADLMELDKSVLYEILEAISISVDI